jgi:hypothetical protein
MPSDEPAPLAPQQSEGAQKRGSSGARSRPVWLVLALLACAGVGILLGRSTASKEPSPTSTTVVEPSPSVVVALRDLARLEGVQFHIERVVDLREKQSRFFDLVQAEDAVLLVAAGDVTAGVDLSGLKEGAVFADRTAGRVTLVLPRATVTSSRLDNNRTYVHTRNTDVLAARRENLETKARQEAERTLQQAALEAGILAKAEDSVARTVESLLRSLGYQQIELRFVGDEQAPAARE